MDNRPIRVLLIEDDENDYEITSHLLAQAEGSDFVVEWADSYSAGLEELAQERHDIYLVDYRLGEGDGIGFLRAASARGRRTAPIILLTGLGDRHLDIAAMEAGATDYLCKDQITSALLERSIRYAIRHKQSEDELRIAEEKYRSIFENAGDGIFRTTPEGRVMETNPAATRILGYASPAEAKALLTDVGSQLYVESDGRQKLLELLKLTGHVEGYEIQVYRKDGSIIWLDVNLRLVRDSTGNVLFYEGSFQDITERKEAVEWMQRAKEELEARVVQRTLDLQKANEQLQQELVERERIQQEVHNAKEEAEQANNAKSEFLSRMSHELRTPLNAIIGFAQLFKTEHLGAKERENVEQILRGGHHLLQLINEVLDITRIETGCLEMSIEPLAMQQGMEEVLALVGPLAAQRRIQIHYDGEDFRDYNVLADRQRMQQILLNLLANAVKYNIEAGSVTISGEEVAGARLRLNIADTGPGIAAEDLKKLFSPFERLGVEGSSVEGSGLGLALSKQMVEALNGRIGVESVAGLGSTFWIELPLAQNSPPQWQQNTIEVEDAATALMPDAMNAPSTLAQHTVLCIEDNLANLILVERVLEIRPEIRCLTAMQGSMGLEMAYQHRSDLILLDMCLPDIMGDEVLRRLQKNELTCDIPVVILSSDAFPDHIHHLMELGAISYLTKPLDIPQFLDVINETLSNIRTGRELVASGSY